MFFFTASKLQFRHRVEGLRTHRFWLARARLVVAFGLFGSSAPCGKVANAPFLAAFFLACVLHALGTKLAAVRGFRKLRIGAFCLAWARILLLFGRFAWAPSRHHGTSADGLAWVLLSAPPRHLALAAVRGFRKLRIGAFCLAWAWARILLLFGRFAWAPSRHHGTSADGLAWALLSAPPRHLALRYTGFGPSLAARVLATRNVLWIPKVTGSIFSGLCFWLA